MNNNDIFNELFNESNNNDDSFKNYIKDLEQECNRFISDLNGKLSSASSKTYHKLNELEGKYHKKVLKNIDNKKLSELERIKEILSLKKQYENELNNISNENETNQHEQKIENEEQLNNLKSKNNQEQYDQEQNNEQEIHDTKENNEQERHKNKMKNSEDERNEDERNEDELNNKKKENEKTLHEKRIEHVKELKKENEELRKYYKKWSSEKKEEFSNTILKNVRKDYDAAWEYIYQIPRKLYYKIFDLTNTYTNKMWFDNIGSGISKTGQNYEKYFTEIAGRIGSDSRTDTHDLIKDTIKAVNDNAYTAKGLNFNDDVFPKLEAAVKAGFQGEEATSVAISNAIDSKIMPWLNTSSETWTQLQYNLSDDSLNQIKAQQLLLQETREGNRILQSGVVDELSDSLLPIMESIDANGTNMEDLGDAYELAEQLMNNGMSRSDAIAYTKKMIKAETDTYGALTSGDPSMVLAGLGSMNGGGLNGAVEMVSNTFGKMISGTESELGRSALGHVSNLVLPSDDEYYKDIYDIHLTGKYANASAQDYKNKVNNLGENVTATQAQDNKVENWSAEASMDVNLLAHGNDMLSDIYKSLVDVKNDLLTKILPAIIGNGITNMFGNKNGADPDPDDVFNDFFGESGQNGSQAHNNTVGNTANNSIKSIGGKLANGAKAVGKFMSGKGGAAVSTAANAAIAIKGGYDIYKGATDNTQSSEEKEQKIRGGVIQGVGGVAGVATSMLVGGPAGLAVAGVVIGAKALSDHYAELADGTAAITEAFANTKLTIDQENEERNTSLKSIKDQALGIKDVNQKLKFLEQNGIDVIGAKLNTFGDNEEKVNNELEKYIDNLIDTNDTLSDEAKDDIDAITGKLKDDTNEDLDRVKEAGIQYTKKSKIIDDLYEKGLIEDKDNLTKEDKKRIEREQKIRLKKFGYTDDQLEALFKHGINGAASDKEIKNFFNKGSVDGKNIGSFENIYESGQVNIEDVNRGLRAMGYDEMTDWENIATNSGPYATALRTISKNKKDKDDQSNLKKYESAKELLLSADDDMKQTAIVELINNNEKFIKWGYNLSNKSSIDDIDKVINSFKVGSQYIPYDQLAQLHEGERVLTKEQNAQYQNNVKEINKLLDDTYNTKTNSISDIVKLANYYNESNVSNISNNETQNNESIHEVELSSTSNDNIIIGLQDVVLAIQTQTKDIISYLSSINPNLVSTNNISNLDYNPQMGNTRSFAKI